MWQPYCSAVYEGLTGNNETVLELAMGGHNIAFSSERAIICTLFTCVVLLGAATIAVPLLLVLGATAVLRYKLVYFIEEAFQNAVAAAKARRAPQADANVLQGVLRTINAFDAGMDTEPGSLTDASDDTEMWRGTHDGQQDAVITPRGARDMITSNNALVEGPLTSRVSRRVAFIDSTMHAAAHPALTISAGQRSEKAGAIKDVNMVESSDSSLLSMLAPSTPPSAAVEALARTSPAPEYRFGPADKEHPRPFNKSMKEDEFRKYWEGVWGFTEDEVSRYINGHAGGGLAAAYKAISLTATFRRDHETHNILQQQQPFFEELKGFFTHGTVGLAKDGSPIWQIKVGEVEEGYRKYKASIITKRDVDRHISFCQDYLYKVLDSRPLPAGKSYWILDLKGLSPVSLASPAVLFGIELMTVIERHYPERLITAFVVNTPYFFALFWKIVKPLMPAATKKRLNIMQDQKQYLAALRDVISDEVIPVEYGGLNTMKKCYESSEETGLLDLAKQNQASALLSNK